MKTLLCLFATFVCITLSAQSQQLKIGVAGNGYVTTQTDGAKITQSGLSNWTNPASIVSIYFYL